MLSAIEDDSHKVLPPDSLAELEALTARLTSYSRRLEQRYSLSRSDSEDLVQDALVVFISSRAAIVRPFEWLVTVLRRSCMRLLRSRSQRTISIEELNEGGLSPVSVLPSNVLYDRLRVEEALRPLSSRHRECLSLRFVLGMSWAEMATDLGCKPSAAKKALQRAVAAAREARRD